MKRQKKQYPEDFKSLLGFSTVSWVQGFATMIYALFMQFLTDYSGIDAAIGKAGYAAAFGTVILLITRIIDAVDDPLQAWIMDSAPERKSGKYRRFTFWGILLIGVGIILMFTLPDFVKRNKVLLFIWILFGYILFEMGSAFNGTGPIIQKATIDANVRTKITSLLRMGIIIAIIPSVFFIPIVTAANASIGDMGKSFSIVTIIITIIYCAISLGGLALIKEPYLGNTKEEGKEEATKLSWRDVWEMLKTNKPLLVHNLAYFIGNMSYAVSSAVLVYFLKWFYCADMATGVVDEAKYASIYGIYGVISLIPNFLTPLVAGFVVKKLGSVDKAARVTVLLGGIGYGLVIVLYFLGILQLSPWVFIFLNLIAGIPASIAVIPSMLLNTECADYVEYNTGKNMAAMTAAVNGVVQKAQSAIAVVIPGLILTSVGYSVDSVTGNYAGDLTKLPTMVFGLVVATSLIPFLVSVGSWAVYKFGYDITPEYRVKMTAELERRRALAAEAAKEQ
ncbi:MAG: MFS transporter [Oscillospiraceae bacterium]|nr:MFS transporter [Oscillospiraceae bacterium]